MKIIEKIREKFARSFLLQTATEQSRKQVPTNLDNAQTAIILYQVEDEATYKAAENIISRLNDFNLKIRVVAFTSQKIIPHYFIPKITQDIITSKDINWRYFPTKAFFKDLISNKFDILIDLTLSDNYPLLYCAVLSAAGLKAGRFQENNQAFYDLLIHTSPGETIDSFAEQMIHYLSRINN